MRSVCHIHGYVFKKNPRTLFNHSSSFNYSIELLIYSSNSRNHAIEAENKKLKECHMEQRWLFIVDHQRGMNRFFLMWKLSRERQMEG